jgi:hypothetical protein
VATVIDARIVDCMLKSVIVVCGLFGGFSAGIFTHSWQTYHGKEIIFAFLLEQILEKLISYLLADLLPIASFIFYKISPFATSLLEC